MCQNLSLPDLAFYASEGLTKITGDKLWLQLEQRSGGGGGGGGWALALAEYGLQGVGLAVKKGSWWSYTSPPPGREEILLVQVSFFWTFTSIDDPESITLCGVPKSVGVSSSKKLHVSKEWSSKNFLAASSFCLTFPRKYVARSDFCRPLVKLWIPKVICVQKTVVVGLQTS